jgi:hypothetical protein
MKQILRTTYRDIRLTADGQVAAYRSPHKRSDAFAQSVVDRHSKSLLRLSTATLIFRQSEPSVETHSTIQQTHLHIQPRLSLTFNSSADQGGNWNPERSTITERIREVVLKPMIRHRISEVMVERIINRQVREDSLALPAKTANASTVTDSMQPELIAAALPRKRRISEATDEDPLVYREPAKPVERILLRTPEKATVETAFQNKKRAGMERIDSVAEPIKTNLPRQTTQARANLSDSDFTRITDQVLKTIDKRVIAARERVGRS